MLIAVAAALGGCGFHPLYGGRTAGAYDPDLATIKVASIPNRAGQILALSLRERLNPRGVEAPVRYTLRTTIAVSRNNLGIERNATSMRGQVDVVAEYDLIGPGGAVLLHGRSHTISAFNIVLDGYATQVAQDDARDRALADISDDMVTNLSLFVRNRRAASN
ncbi:MAG TPA: LPS assembly lipoprotein LptE [Stellaceae bacterium]|nr:LPS assembly lipoprotein LptE [Stellaceae bacterium]